MADYGKPILFLLSKTDLTKDEQHALGNIVEFKPELDELEEIAKRGKPLSRPL